jgi:hypothetical protein
MPEQRSTTEIINNALRENAKWEWLCYVGIVVFVVIGLTTLIVGLIRGESITSIVGGVVTSLFWPGLRFADQFRRENLKIRLYEDALNKAKTAQQAMDVLDCIFSVQSTKNGKSGGKLS